MISEPYNPTHDIVCRNVLQLHCEEEAIKNNTNIYELIDFILKNIETRINLLKDIHNFEKSEQIRSEKLTESLIQKSEMSKNSSMVTNKDSNNPESNQPSTQINQKKAAFLKTSATFSTSFKYNKRLNMMTGMSPARSNSFVSNIVEETNEDDTSTYRSIRGSMQRTSFYYNKNITSVNNKCPEKQPKINNFASSKEFFTKYKDMEPIQTQAFKSTKSINLDSSGRLE